MKKQLFILTALLFVILMCSNAQEAILTTGGDVSSSTGSVSYSVGQIVYTTNTGTTGSVAQGVQQPYEISVSTAIKGSEDILLDFTAYPNPVKDILRLKTGERNFDGITYQLYEINGKIVEKKIVTATETMISMSDFPKGIYLLKMIDSNKVLKTFKIIKR